MTITEMLGQSIILTGLGMGVVFSFLIIMIIFMTISSKVINSLNLDKEKNETTGTAASNASAAQTNGVVAAIATAVREKNSK